MVRPRVLILAAALALAGLGGLRVTQRLIAPRLEQAVAGEGSSSLLRPAVAGESPGASFSPAVSRTSRDIVRDGPTRAAIEATRSVHLPRHDESRLTLRVEKSRARLQVLDQGGAVLRTFPVAFGGQPFGAKERQGDQRTPEGRYLLLPHHPSPSFGPCFYVTYPNEADAERGLREGLITEREAAAIERALRAESRPPHDTELGGLILLHGTKDRGQLGLTEWNWTLGCIAMENRDLEELLASFEASDRPWLEIRP